MKYRTRREIGLGACIALIFLVLGYFLCLLYGIDNKFKNKHDIVQAMITESPISSNVATQNESIIPITNLVAYKDELLTLLQEYDHTMRSCLGSYCFDEKWGTIERIGLLSPLASGSESILNVIHMLTPDTPQFTVTYDTHVPGKLP